MYSALLFVPFSYAIGLAGFVFVPGLAALIVTFATNTAAPPRGSGQPDTSGWLAVVNGMSSQVSVVLLALACGFVELDYSAFSSMSRS